jgi:hypothetical protein
MFGDRLVRVLHHAFIVLIVVGSMAALSAQAVLDPRFVEFIASHDHDMLSDSGLPRVSRYTLSIYPVGSSSVLATVDLGKPTPRTDGVIRVDFLPLLPALPAPNVSYEARVTVVGPGGRWPAQYPTNSRSRRRARRSSLRPAGRCRRPATPETWR